MIDPPSQRSERAVSLPPRRRILVAEDDGAISELLRIRLENAGHHAFFARDGVAAMQAFRVVRPQAVILDIGLPRANGFEVLSHIKFGQELRDVPVLMLTARHQESDVQRSIVLGAEDFVTKPFDDDKLVQRVERLMARYAAA